MSTAIEQTSSKGKRPEFELFLVIDHEHKATQWVKLTGLFKSSNGTSYSGQLQPHVTVPAGSRLVILPAKADDAAAESDAS